jgi:hypothetical protein
MHLLAWLVACTPETQIRAFEPEFAVSPPPPLDFGPVVVGESAALELYVTNAGRALLQGTIGIDPTSPDVFSIPVTEIQLEPDESLTLPVTFTPEEFVDYAAVLRFTTNDPDQATVDHAVTGTGRPVPVPDLVPCAEALDFGVVAPGETADEVCLLANAGEADLELGAVIQTGSGAFSLVTDPSGAVVSAGSSLPVILRYAPVTDTGDSAELRFPSNDPDQPEVRLQLTGNGGGTSIYPEAVILWGDPGSEPDRLCPAAVAPVADLPLTGETSIDPLGGGLSYVWTVTDRPTGGQGTFSDASIPSPTLHVDVAGEWAVQLQVVAADGTSSAPARCLISAVPTDDVRVELSWDGPTSDFDLHLADATDTPLYAVPGDVSPCNPSPAWGAALDQDDADGLGPESIAIAQADDGTYPVRVHYFARNADFAVTATVRVWLGGSLAYAGSTSLDFNEVWDVGVVNWPDATFGVTGGSPEIAATRQCE